MIKTVMASQKIPNIIRNLPISTPLTLKIIPPIIRPKPLNTNGIMKHRDMMSVTMPAVPVEPEPLLESTPATALSYPTFQETSLFCDAR